MNELSIITRPVELKPIPEFKNPALTSAAQRLNEIRIDTASRVSSAVRETASLFATINEKELYKDDGFNSTTEFGEKIFGYGKSMVSLYVNAGKIYNNEESPAFLQNLSPFSLQEIKNIPVDVVMDAVKNGDIANTPTQASLRKFAQDYKAAHSEPKVEDRYTVKYLWGGQMRVADGYETADSFKEFVSGLIGNNIAVINAPPVEIYKIAKDGKPAVDKAGNPKTLKLPRKIYLNIDTSDVIVAVFTPYMPPKSKKSEKTVSSDTAILDKAVELLSQGLIDETVFKAMTGMSPDEAATDPGEVE